MYQQCRTVHVDPALAALYRRRDALDSLIHVLEKYQGTKAGPEPLPGAAATRQPREIRMLEAER